MLGREQQFPDRQRLAGRQAECVGQRGRVSGNLVKGSDGAQRRQPAELMIGRQRQFDALRAAFRHITGVDRVSRQICRCLKLHMFHPAPPLYT